MDKSRIAVAIIAYNEENNIRKLIESILAEKINNLEIFVSTEGCRDKTPEIVDEMEHKYTDQIRHIRGEKRISKHLAYNSLLARIDGYKYVCFMDGDITLTKNSIGKLWTWAKQHPQYKIAAPLQLPLKSNLSKTGNKISEIYRKIKIIIAEEERYRYFTGRCFIVRTKELPKIPNESYTDDFYLNLQFEPEEIATFTGSVVGYVMPTTLTGIIRYSFRMGNSLGYIKRNFPWMWKKQKLRLSIIDYAVFGMVQHELIKLGRQLNFLEIVIYFYSRLITLSGFVWGFLSRRKTFYWEPLSETKIIY